MRQDVQAQRTSGHGRQSYSVCSAGEKKSLFKNSGTIACDAGTKEKKEKTLCCHAHGTWGDGCTGHEPGGMGTWAVLLLLLVPGCIPHPGDAQGCILHPWMPTSGAGHHSDTMWPCASFLPCQAWAERGCLDCCRMSALHGPLFFPAAGRHARAFSPSPSSCLGPGSFSAGFLSWVLGQAQASDEISLVKPKLLEFSSSFCFLWRGSWLKQVVFSFKHSAHHFP